jgi:MGT family glycosyltransferase
MADTPYLDPLPDVLQPPDDQPFADVIRIRPDAGEVRPGDVLPERVLAQPFERTVYLTLGTVFNAAAEFAVSLDALRDLPVNVVLTCGFGTEPEAFEPLPSNVAVEQYVSQALLLPRCSAVVCHAGAGTVIGALAHGVPLVCLPRGADQFGNAEQISRIGAGITLLPDQVSAETIRDATRSVLDDNSYAAAAASVRTEIERLPDPSAVVEELVRRAG